MPDFLKIHWLVVFILFGIIKGADAQNALAPLPVEKVDASMKSSAKPILMLLSTDWCKFCQMQKNLVRKHKQFLAQKDNFYYVEFNAESKNDITFAGQEYVYKASSVSSGMHELALKLGSEKTGISYPTWVLLDKNYQIVFRNSGVLTTSQLNTVMKGIQEMNKKAIKK